MATFHELSVVQLKQAVHLREQIESLQEKLDVLLGGSSTKTPKKKLGRPPGKKHTMSAAARALIGAAQKARWAKINGISSTKASAKKSTAVKASVKTAPKAVVAGATPKKKGMSPETKAKLAAAMKARWVAKKKGDE